MVLLPGHEGSVMSIRLQGGGEDLPVPDQGSGGRQGRWKPVLFMQRFVQMTSSRLSLILVSVLIPHLTPQMTSNEPPNDLKYSNDLKYPK